MRFGEKTEQKIRACIYFSSPSNLELTLFVTTCISIVHLLQLMSQVDTSILCFTVLHSTMLHIHCFYSESESRSVVSSSLWHHRLQPTRLLCPWHSPGQNTRVGNCSLLQGIFSTQESKTGLPRYRQILYHLSLQGRFMTTLHALSKFVDAIFPSAFSHFVSLCHVLVILIVFPIF